MMSTLPLHCICDTVRKCVCLQVKADTDEDTDSVCVYEQVIADLRKQLEDQSLSQDVLRQSETNLKLSLRLTQQSVDEVKTKLVYAAERQVYTVPTFLKTSGHLGLNNVQIRGVPPFQG